MQNFMLAEGDDRVCAFTIPDRDVRGRLVRLGPVLTEVLSAHAYPASLRELLAEALVLTALTGSLLKDQDSQMTIQAQADGGAIDLLVCDYRNGELRGYVRHDEARLAHLADKPNLARLFGNGYLAITFDLAVNGQRYQGVVPLEGESLAQACEAYFAQSEQVPTLIRIAADCAEGRCTAGGLLLQHLPEGEEGRERLHVNMAHPHWEHAATMAGSVKHDELVDLALPPEALLWRLFHEEREVLVMPGERLSRGCRCTEKYYREILSRFTEEDLAEMRDEKGVISIDCAFCSKVFPLAM